MDVDLAEHRTREVAHAADGEAGGYARCRTIGVADGQGFVNCSGSVPESTVEQVDMVLRAALSL